MPQCIPLANREGEILRRALPVTLVYAAAGGYWHDAPRQRG
jgi:hypothetical protein